MEKGNERSEIKGRFYGLKLEPSCARQLSVPVVSELAECGLSIDMAPSGIIIIRWMLKCTGAAYAVICYTG